MTRPVRLPEQLARSQRSDLQRREEKWKKFKRAWLSYYRAAKVYEDDSADQVATLLNIIGDAGLDLYETFVFDRPANADPNDADQESHITIEAVLAKFEEYCKPKVDPSSDTTSTRAHSRAVNRTTTSSLRSRSWHICVTSATSKMSR